MSRSCKHIAAMTPGMIAVGLGGVGVAPLQAQIQFDDPTLYQAGGVISGAAAADLTGNGLIDIAICERDEVVSIFENEDGGAYRLLGSMREAGYQHSSIRAADLDRDGDKDLIWVRWRDNHSYSLKVMYNDGRGRVARMNAIPLARVTTDMVIGDLTGDGWPDVALLQGNTVQVLTNFSGTLYEGAAWHLPYADSRGLAIGDIDTDGDLDIATLNMRSTHDSYYGWKIYESAVEVLLNDGAGGFVDERSVPLPFGNNYNDPFPMSLQVGDLDGDYDLDLVIGASQLDDNDPVELLLLENEGDVSFTTHDTSALGDSRNFAPVAVGDLDTDGDLDLVLTTSLQQTWILENRGRFSFDARVLSAAFGSRSAEPALADVSEDGQVDLVMADAQTLKVAANTSPYEGPLLSATPLKRGQMSTLTVNGALSGERVHFLYSLEGAGNSRGLQRFGGITMDLTGTIYEAGDAVADADGVARITLTVPNNAPLRSVIIQAAIRRGVGGVDSVKTPFRTAVIQP